MLTASKGGDVRVYRTSTGGVLPARLRHGAPVTAAALTRDGRTAATVGEDGRVRIWDVTRGTGRLQPASRTPIRVFRFSPDGALLAAAGSTGFAASVWRTADGALVHRLRIRERDDTTSIRRRDAAHRRQ